MKDSRFSNTMLFIIVTTLLAIYNVARDIRTELKQTNQYLAPIECTMDFTPPEWSDIPEEAL